MEPRTIIVNDKDEIIGYKNRDEIKESDIYRVSALQITNSKGEILLARRHRSKKHDPLKWGPAVAGTVEEGETYLENIIKEAEEELGLKNIKPVPTAKTRNEGKHPHFTQAFKLIIDKEVKDFTIQEDEVEEIKWFKKEELLKEIEKNPNEFLTSIKKYI